MIEWLDRLDLGGRLESFTDILSYLKVSDLVEILIIAFLIYHIFAWIKSSRAWYLLKGVIVIAVFLLFAAIFKMNTILWIAGNVMGFAVTAIIIVLQPELRKALEELGKKNVLYSFLPDDTEKRKEESFSEKTINEIVKACVEMARARTGALIVVKVADPLDDIERTGIEVDGIVTSQLLINIFEHNTPLHDGAVVISGNRVTSATCYLPLSDNMDLGKELGTRHRAGVGISEVSDSLTVIVSEETGSISVAQGSSLERDLDAGQLTERLKQIQKVEDQEEKSRHIWPWKGRSKEKV